MATNFEVVGFAVSTIAPIYAVTVLGAYLRRRGILSDDFLKDSAHIIFNYAAPIMLFLSLAGADLSSGVISRFIFVSLGIVLAMALLAYLIAPFMVKDRHDRGVFLQGAVRGNILVSGLALSQTIYGVEGIALASLLIGLFIIFNNVFSVGVLKYYAQTTDRGAGNYWRDIVRNPIIISVVLGTGVGFLELPIPTLIVATGNLLGQLTVPLILINVGAALDFGHLRSPSAGAWAACCFKSLLTPLVGVPVGYYLGLRQMELGILFLLLSAPTATISVVFVQLFGGNTRMAANTVLLSGLVSFVVIVVGLIGLRSAQLI